MKGLSNTAKVLLQAPLVKAAADLIEVSIGQTGKLARGHVSTPHTVVNLVCRLLLEKN